MSTTQTIVSEQSAALRLPVEDSSSSEEVEQDNDDVVDEEPEVQVEEQTEDDDDQTLTMEERYLASILLAAAGDALGYKNGEFEFCSNTLAIHQSVRRMGGLANINIRGWSVSDDTVMHLATMRALVQVYSDLESLKGKDQNEIIHKLMSVMANEYIICFRDMGGRAPGATCGSGVSMLRRNGIENWNTIPYSPYGGGCGGSMRAMAIGLLFHGQEQRDMLVAIGIEAGRLTHNHPTGFLGSLVAGAFTAYAIEGIPVNQWGYYLLHDLIPRAQAYLQQNGRDWEKISVDINAFIKQWTRYLQERQLESLDNNGPVFPAQYGIEERDVFYTSFSFRGWAGASGDDSVIIAYDALLGAGNNWEDCIHRAAFHAGDSDSTGTIAAAWFGALYGFRGVPRGNYATVEKYRELTDLAQKIFQISHPNKDEEEKQ